MATTAYQPATIRAELKGKPATIALEHPFVVRLCHWLNAIALLVLIGTGLRIFDAFPAFSQKIPQHDLLHIPGWITMGGWLGGALQWHFTFMWIFVGAGALYIVYELVTGHFRQVLFLPRDLSGVWPMARHYFFFGPKPLLRETYNPLQKLAYTFAIACGALSLVSGLVLYKPVQLGWLAFLMGGYHLARIWHFLALCGFLAFIPGHLVMVALHGWQNFASMVRGWKPDPEYIPVPSIERPAPAAVAPSPRKQN